jgi:hypothetical protein
MAINKEKNVREPVTLPRDMVARIEDYRRTQTPIPSKAAAIRALIEFGLKAAKKPRRK